MHEVTEGLLIAVLGVHLVLLFFIAWQFARFSKCLRYYIRRLRRLVIGEMDCGELIDALMSVAEQRQGTSAGLAEGAPPAAAPVGGRAMTPDTPEGQGEERVQKHCERLAVIVTGGQAGQYGRVVRRKTFTAYQINALDSELYQRYGVFLAPLTAVLTTLKHCQFGHQCPVRISDGEDEGGASTESSGKS